MLSPSPGPVSEHRHSPSSCSCRRTLPLALTKGAGTAAQNAIGTAVTGGLLSATFIDLIFIPFFFVLIMRIFSRKRPVAG